MDGGGDSSLALPARVLLYYNNAVPTISMQSIVAQLAFYTTTLKGWGFASDESVDPGAISDANLQNYALLAMINTCFSPFGQNNPDEPQSMVIQRFLQRGGSLFGTHCADVTFQGQTPVSLYNQLIGGRGGAPPGGTAYFQGNNDCRKVADHPSTAMLPATFPFMGNLDNTDYLAPDTTVLVKCTWVTTNGADVAVSWYRNEGLGRVFYTDFAKIDTDLTDPVIGAEHIVPALSWALRRP
jgi:type 1 glutamine amidotransferase